MSENKNNYTPPYIYVGLCEYEQRCEEENAEVFTKLAEAGHGTRMFRVPSLVWTDECLPPNWDGVIKKEYNYLFQ